MKKVLSLIIVLLIVFAVGCSSSNKNIPEQQNQQSANDNQPVQSPQNENTPDTSSFIGEDSAKEIALERAGLSANQVVFDRVELDRDDGIYRYEVEFREGKTEYDAEIKADDGTIISWKTDFND